MCLRTKRIDDQLRWLIYARIAVQGLRYMPKRIEKNFNDIRAMHRHELRRFIHEHQTECDRVRKRKYTPDDAFIASKVVYAQNRLVLM